MRELTYEIQKRIGTEIGNRKDEKIITVKSQQETANGRGRKEKEGRQSGKEGGRKLRGR